MQTQNENPNKRRNLMIDDATLENARVLGGGNASAGVRMAVRHLVQSMSGGPVLAELRQWLDRCSDAAGVNPVQRSCIVIPPEGGNPQGSHAMPAMPATGREA